MISKLSLSSISFSPRLRSNDLKNSPSPSFKASFADENDTVEFNKNIGLNVLDKEKIKMLDEILSKKLKNYKACIDYFKEECIESKEKTIKEIETSLNTDVISSDFLKKTLEAMDKARSKEEAYMIAQDAIDRSALLVETYSDNGGLQKKVDKGYNAAKKGLVEIVANAAQVQDCFNKSTTLDDVPERLKVGGQKVSMIEDYFMKMYKEQERTRELHNIGIDIMRAYDKNLRNFKDSVTEFLDNSAYYLMKINKKIQELEK